MAGTVCAENARGGQSFPKTHGQCGAGRKNRNLPKSGAGNRLQERAGDGVADRVGLGVGQRTIGGAKLHGKGDALVALGKKREEGKEREGKGGKERTVVKDEPFPPTERSGQKYRLVDRTNNGAGGR